VPVPDRLEFDAHGIAELADLQVGTDGRHDFHHLAVVVVGVHALPDIGRDFLGVEDNVRTEVENGHLGGRVMRAVPILDAHDILLLLAAHPKPRTHRFVLRHAVETIAHLGGLKNEQLFRDPVHLPIAQDLEKDLPHFFGNFGRVASDLEDVQDHLETRHGLVVDLFRDGIGVFWLDVG